jgi:uncharacterized protein YndB with AHSA1/START domain
MIDFQIEIEIERPVEVVYEFLSNIENLPKWNYFVTEVRKISKGPPAVGAIFHQKRKTDSQKLTIVELEKEQLLTIETIPPSKPQLWRCLKFEALNTKTRIIDQWQLDTGRPRFLQVLGKSRIKLAVRENLEKLKELLEVGQVTLQDGRQVSL